MNKPINLVFLGGFEFPEGMADTKRIHHAINGLKTDSDIAIKVVVLRQSSKTNALDGIHRGIPYQTIMGDLLRWRMLLLAPLLHMKARRAIKALFRARSQNILYVYGPPSFDNLPTIRYAKRLGFKLIFDIVEDYELSRDISNSLWHKLKINYICHLNAKIVNLADGIVVISSHLEKKYRTLTSGASPLLRMPIAVDMDRYPYVGGPFGDPVTLFYAGSFGVKDGVPVLLEAFDSLASRRANVRLVMTGVGSREVMNTVTARVQASPHADRIVYKGFLGDEAYYETLNAADILCMPRIDIGYANAGFPFKLGEYLATGKPVIASKVSDIPEILTNLADAMLVNPGRCGDIVAAAEFLLDNPERARAIGERGKAVAGNLFDFRSQGMALRRFIGEINGSGGGCAASPEIGHRVQRGNASEAAR